MARLTFTRHLSRFFPALVDGEVPGATVREILDELERRHPGFEPSPYVSGREWTAGQAVQSQDTDDFVDVSEPPTSEVDEASATSTSATK